jgi:putative glutamine amidotransferase
MNPPLIGLTTTRVQDESGRVRDSLTQEYAQAVVQAGGLPVLIPLSTIESGDTDLLRAIYERLDGVIIPGGGDIHPEYYGDYVTEYDRDISRLRDKAELTLVQWAYEDDCPLLGICRGHQVVNVALGGTLIHDIDAKLNGAALEHDAQTIEKRSQVVHEIVISYGSRLADIFGLTSIGVNSIHHQAVDKIAPPLVATAFTSDGIVEGIEAPNATFLIGVQWHPEAILDAVPEMRTLFANFVKICAKQQHRKTAML